jgi:AhpD family alkylhydroperoxidase
MCTKRIFRGNQRLDLVDKEKIEKIRRDRTKADEILQTKSQVYKSFLKLEQKTFSDGNLEKKYKELIAIGISIVLNCEPCLEWHIKEALRSGSSEEQVLESMEVGIEMGGGPATVSSRFALKVLEYYKQKSVH